MDQNPLHKQGLKAVQGMIPLYPVNRAVGGLEVVPATNTDACQAVLRREYADQLAKNKSDFLLVKEGKSYHGQGQLVLAQPGDLILWDSRTVHGGVVGSGDMSHLGIGDLARLSFTVCMTPKKWATRDVLIGRRYAFLNGFT